MRPTLLSLRTFAAAAALAAFVGIALSSGGAAAPEAVLTPADAVSGDQFGSVVALSGDTALAATEQRDSDQGAVYVFRRTGTAWAQEAKLTALDAAAGDAFGSSVAIDGDTALIGAREKLSSRGAAYVFTRSGTTWTQQAKLLATGGTFDDRFGGAVALSGDTAVVGANGVGATVGAVYVFTRSGTVWTQQAKLTASDALDGDALGSSVAVAGDTIVAGAYGVGSLVGAAYVFTRNGTTWTEEARLASPNPANGDSFSIAVAVEGDTAALGSRGENDRRGAVHVFTRSGTTWTPRAKLSALDAAVNDVFGSSLSMNGDRMMVGAHGKHRSAGAAYVFARSGADWTQTTKFAAQNAFDAEFFGLAVAISGDSALAGAFGRAFGEVFAYDLSAGAGAPSGSCLPTKAKVKLNAKKVEKSTLTASGTLDTGTGAPDFSGAATFEVGGFRLDVPAFVRKGRNLSYSSDGMKLTITPAANGSSRAKFVVKWTADVADFVQLDGPLAFCFTNGAHTAFGAAKLTGGVLGRRAVITPTLSVLKAAATLKGGGKDSLSLTPGFATDGQVPGTGEDLTIGFGQTYTSPVLSSFVRKGSTYVRTAKGPGITKATVDHAKGTITISGSGLDLGDFGLGGNPVVVTITRGGRTDTVSVRMSRAGAKLAY